MNIFLSIILTIFCVFLIIITCLLASAHISNKKYYNLIAKKAEFYNEQWNKIVKYLVKSNKLYHITSKLNRLPKCNNCNEDRKIVFTLPDGKTKNIPCSCADYNWEYYVEDISTTLNFILCKDGSVSIGTKEDSYRVDYILKTFEEAKEDFENTSRWSKSYDKYCFTKKTDAEKFLKWYLDNNEDAKK